MIVNKKVVGIVKEGEKVGRKIGFPTINLDYNGLDLAYGVYASKVITPVGVYKGAVHYGPRKILNLVEPCFEVYLLDFSGDLYGQKVEVEVLDKLRDTMDFDDMNLLKEQIKKDVELVKLMTIPL